MSQQQPLPRSAPAPAPDRTTQRPRRARAWAQGWEGAPGPRHAHSRTARGGRPSLRILGLAAALAGGPLCPPPRGHPGVTVATGPAGGRPPSVGGQRRRKASLSGGFRAVPTDALGTLGRGQQPGNSCPSVLCPGVWPSACPLGPWTGSRPWPCPACPCLSLTSPSLAPSLSPGEVTLTSGPGVARMVPYVRGQGRHTGFPWALGSVGDSSPGQLAPRD